MTNEEKAEQDEIRKLLKNLGFTDHEINKILDKQTLKEIKFYIAEYSPINTSIDLLKSKLLSNDAVITKQQAKNIFPLEAEVNPLERKFVYIFMDSGELQFAYSNNINDESDFEFGDFIESITESEAKQIIKVARFRENW